MNLIPLSDNMDHYFEASEVIDYTSPVVQDAAIRLCKTGVSETSQAQITYEYVRDKISHSNDIPEAKRQVACTASEVLEKGQGLCYAKSHLLTALLRCQRIPCGLCYQRLNTEDSYVLHGLVAVWLREQKKWIRLDARGNVGSIKAQFSIGREKLAYSIRTSQGERDYPYIFCSPYYEVIDVLKGYDNYRELSENLPTSLQHCDCLNMERSNS